MPLVEHAVKGVMMGPALPCCSSKEIEKEVPIEEDEADEEEEKTAKEDSDDIEDAGAHDCPAPVELHLCDVISNVMRLTVAQQSSMQRHQGLHCLYWKPKAVHAKCMHASGIMRDKHQ